MINELFHRICELQPSYSKDNTPEMQQRGQAIKELTNEVRNLKSTLVPFLGAYGESFEANGRDGTGNKVETPWVRFCSSAMSPSATRGFYVVIHFSTDGSAAHVTVGCNSTDPMKPGRIRKPKDLLKETSWARRQILSANGTIEPFTDEPDFGATRELPISFQNSTAVSKRIPREDFDTEDIIGLLKTAAEFLAMIYDAQASGKLFDEAEQSEAAISEILRPRRQTNRRRGQGFGLSAPQRKAVEMQAMRLAEAELQSMGFTTRDTSSNRPFDLMAARDGRKYKVEVKGTTSDFGDAFLMTRNEVDLHKREAGKTILILVTSVVLKNEGEKVQATGGVVDVQMGWDIDDWSQEPTHYRISKKK